MVEKKLLKIGLLVLIAIITVGCPKKEHIVFRDIYDKSQNNRMTFKDELASQYFDQALHLSNLDAQKLWNYPMYGPILLVDSDSRELFANEIDSLGVLNKNGRIFKGYMPDSIPIANTAIDWGGKRWTMMMLPLPKNLHSRGSLLMHESFHRIQPLIGFDFTKIDFYSCKHLNQENGRIYLRLELEALKKAIQTASRDDRKNHIRNAILFRKYRHTLFPENRSSENAMELLEGLSEYTGLILSGRTKKEIESNYVRKVDRFYENPTFVRSFAYHTLPAYGYFMYSENENWNHNITINTDLTEFIIQFYAIEIPENLAGVLEKMQAVYGSSEIRLEEEFRAEETKKQELHYRNIFLENPGLILESENLNYSFDPRNVTPLEPEGTVYPSIVINSEWGVLEVEQGGVFINMEGNKVIVSEPLKLGSKIVEGEYWKLTLNKAWRVEYDGRKYKLLREKTGQ